MTALLKAIIGVIIALVGLWLLVPVPGYTNLWAGVALQSFLTLLIGAIPVMLILFGALLAYIEFDEWQTTKKTSKKK